MRVTTDLRPGIEGAGLHARTRMTEGESHFVALSWSRCRRRELWRRPRSGCGGRRSTGANGSRSATSGPPLAQLSPTQRADAEGILTYAPTGRPARGGHHLAAGDPARRAQLGLSLRLGARLDLRLVGPSTRWASTARRTTSSTSFADGCRDGHDLAGDVRRLAASGNSTKNRCRTSQVTRARFRFGQATGHITSSSSTMSGAPCLTRYTCGARARDQLPESLWSILKRQVDCAAEHWRNPTAGYGGARGTAALSYPAS